MYDKIRKTAAVFSIASIALFIVASIIVPIVLAICLRNARLLSIWTTTPILLVLFWALLDLFETDLRYHK